eukprot:TRINITY_DN6519_c1_g1_i1.p1 TRINITY_DN6519_c1_g1~~TRINITY_DN6519_c1_g1_i1.p1  ORF type:complete len:321 (+),score=65.58 TRINITY_DN6519_c1_g1_i1:43-1005(+)
MQPPPSPPLRAMKAPQPPTSGDAGVIATNDAATSSKLRAVHLGYYADPYIGKVAKMVPTGIAAESPLVRRGYWARVRFVEKCIAAFACKHKEFQVVSVGCGYDSSFFRLRKHYEGRLRRWADVDLPQVIAKKKKHVEEDQVVASLLEDSIYQMLAFDLRDPGLPDALFKNCLIDADIPTLCISECVLVYLRPEDGDVLLRSFASRLRTVSIVTYEQINPTTPFGQRMLTNLAARGCPLLSYSAYPTLEAQVDRYLSAGFTSCSAKDMNDVWASLSAADKLRVSKIELLDEIEEWVLIHSHYSFICASKGTPDWDIEVFTP